MKALRLLSICLVLGALGASTGCLCVPRAQLARSESEKRILAEQCRAQLAEIENLTIHSRSTTDRLLRTEKELAQLQDEVGLDREQLQDIRQERAKLHGQFKGLANGRAPIPPEVSTQLAELSQRYPNLHFDPVTGISKLDTDVLFDSGDAELKPGAEEMLGELVQVLKSPRARDLKIMVAGHTDDRQIAKKPAREEFPNNFYLSTARAHAVADLMCRQGLSQQRLAVAGFGANQPVAPNATSKDRQKNRRVEIFVMHRDVPVVGWTDSIPSVY